MEKEVRRTMKSLSAAEVDNRKQLDLMIPMDIPGRFQLMTKLKDLTIHVDKVVVKPIYHIPHIISDTIGFFSTDGFWTGNFIAYGHNLKGRNTLLWDDFGIDMERKENCVVTNFIKERLMANNNIIIVTAKTEHYSNTLEFYMYIPH